MDKKIRCSLLFAFTCSLGLFLDLSADAQAASPGSLLLNAANTISGGQYLEKGKSDATLGRVQGNGQNWLTFIVAGNDTGSRTLDLRGWEMDWSYHKSDNTSFGSGVMQFSEDPIWSAVPQGTLITINEYQKAWYLVNTPPAPGNPNGDPYTDPGTGLPGGGMQRDGGINGFNQQTGSAFNPAIDTMRDFSTNTIMNPLALGGADWNINVWAGEGLNSATGAGQFFNFSGSVTKNADNSGEGGTTSAIGLDPAAGLFVSNNDNWQFTLKDNLGNVIQGPIGEAVSGWGLTNGQPNGAGGVGSTELLKLQAFTANDNATAASYQNVTIANYADGTTSNYGAPNQWTVAGNLVTQDFSPLRNWFSGIATGDVNLDGVVDIQDVTVVANHWLQQTGFQGGDANGDGAVDIQDITAIANNWLAEGGGGGASATLVPEPSTGLIATVGILASAFIAFLKRRSSGAHIGSLTC